MRTSTSSPWWPRAALLVLLAVLSGCDTGSGGGDVSGDTSSIAGGHASSDDPPRWRAPRGPAPWDDGWPREWFYAHPRPADDWRWARMAQHVGHPAPPLEDLEDWRHGEPVTLESLRGRLVLLKFWATWCSDCRASVASTEATAERLADDVTVLEICARKGGAAYGESLESWGVGQRAALDADGTTERAYDVPRWPFYVLIDRQGVVRATGLRTAHVDAALDHLLALDPR